MANIIMGFRESLEAILLISVIVVFLTKNNLTNYKKYAYYGLGAGVVVSLIIALVLGYLEKMMVSQGEVIEMVWELGSALVASVLLCIMVVGMIKNKGSISRDIEEKTSRNVSKTSIFLISLLMVAREGFELILFVLANPDKSNVALEVIIGITIACLFGIALNKSIIKVNLKTVFKFLLIYLILQIGALFGAAIREFSELLEYLNVAPGNIILYSNLYDFSNTLLGRENPIGMILNLVAGWNPRPQILQFIGQYSITGYLVYLYNKYSKKS